MDGGVRHSSAEARGAEPALFARERDELREPPLAAREVETAVLEAPATQVLLELLHDEARQSALLLGALEVRRPALRCREGVCGMAHATAASASGAPAQ